MDMTSTAQEQNPYANYGNKQLADTHAFWMGVYRAAKNQQQRARADRGASLAAQEMRARSAIAKATS
jgi:hypothetical protein